MRVFFGAAAALAIGVSTAAYADGYAVRSAPGYAPFSWTGFYVGGNAGYAWDAGDRDITLSNGSTTIDANRSFDARGGFVGVQAGYNWQRGLLVLGVETDIQGGNIKDTFGPIFIPAGGVSVNGEKRLDFFGTVRGRLGFAVDRFLVYATGGFAYGGINDTLFVFDGGPNSANLRRDDTRTGWAAGGGLEYALDQNLSLKVEYLRLDLGSEKMSAPVIPLNGTTITSSRIDHAFDTVRLGLNVRFDADRFVPLK